MLPYIQIAGITNNNHAVNDLLALLSSNSYDGDNIQTTIDNADAASFQSKVTANFNFNNSGTCGTLFDITKFIPLWVVKEKNERENRGESTTTIFDFIQKYYDWLYCDGASGAQYGLSRNILDLIDIKRTKDNLIQNLYNTYAESATGVFDATTFSVGRAELEKFLTGIRSNFYHRKGTEDGIRHLLTTLFVIDDQDIQIEVPKQFIMRLNGGKFISGNFHFRGGTGDTGDYLSRGDLAGSYLNGSVLQDSSWFHDYSYIVYAGENYQNNDEIANIYKNINHPAGTGVIFGKQLSDYVPVAPRDEDSTVCEYPLLKNYSPYSLFTFYGPTLNSLGTINGFTFYGITSCIGCCGASYSGFTGPTHRFPSWTQNTSATQFQNINILDFILLCYDSGLTSPNETLTCTGCN